jgi:type 1 glutamine amidotransferase
MSKPTFSQDLARMFHKYSRFPINTVVLAAITAWTILATVMVMPTQGAQSTPDKLLVFIAAENEYHAWQTLPAFGQMLENKYGFRCDYLTSSTDDKDTNRFFIPRMEKVKQADLVVLFARRRALPKEQMQILRDYLDRGKPLIGIRTASHAFDANLVVPKEGGAPVAANAVLPPGLEQWSTFDEEVFGCSYHGHYGAGVSTAVSVNPEKKGHPILAGVPEAFESPSWLYAVLPLAPTAEALMLGKVPGKDAEPVLLTNTYKQGSRIVYTTMGHWEDFKIPAYQRILINSVFWALKLEKTTDEPR